MFVLETKIISEATRLTPNVAVTSWIAAQSPASLYITTMSLGEILRGILQLPEGRKRRTLEAWFAGPTGPREMFAGRVLAFDAAAARVWAELMSEGRARGRPRSPIDMIVGGVARANAAVLVTLNARDFDGLEVFDPANPAPA